MGSGGGESAIERGVQLGISINRIEIESGAVSAWRGVRKGLFEPGARRGVSVVASDQDVVGRDQSVREHFQLEGFGEVGEVEMVVAAQRLVGVLQDAVGDPMTVGVVNLS